MLGIRAPICVYRALEKLIAGKVVYRLESRSAYVAAMIVGCDTAARPAFAICRSCGDVEALLETRLVLDLTKRLESGGFSVNGATVELQGHCRTCVRPSREKAAADISDLPSPTGTNSRLASR